MFKNLSEEKKQEIRSLYLNSRGTVNVEGLSSQEKLYLAVKFGYYYPIETEINFDIAKEIIKSQSSLISEMLPFCDNKEQQKELVKISMEDQDNSFQIKSSHPELLIGYLDSIKDKRKVSGDSYIFNYKDGPRCRISIKKEEYKKLNEKVLLKDKKVKDQEMHF